MRNGEEERRRVNDGRVARRKGGKIRERRVVRKRGYDGREEER